MQFKSMASDDPLPPEPVITRWGTWTDATIYFCEHFHVVKNTVRVESIKTEDARATEAAYE
jgi:hypothetical protein